MLKVMLRVFFLLSMPFLVNAQTELKFCMDAKNNFPANGVAGTETGKNPGIFVESMRVLEKTAGIKVTYVRSPWKRCLSLLKTGKVDGAICASYKKEREEFGIYPMKDGKPDSMKSFSDSSYYLYTQKSSNAGWDGSKFMNMDKGVGSQLGFSIGPWLKEKGLEVTEVKSAKANFVKLSKGRLSGVAAHADTGDAHMLDHKGLKKSDKPLRSKSYYLIMSHQIYKSNRSLVEKIWEESGKLHRGALKDIRNKYIGKKDWNDL